MANRYEVIEEKEYSQAQALQAKSQEISLFYFNFMVITYQKYINYVKKASTFMIWVNHCLKEERGAVKLVLSNPWDFQKQIRKIKMSIFQRLNIRSLELKILNKILPCID